MRALGIDVGGSSVKAVLLDAVAPLARARSAAYDRPSLGSLREAIDDAAERATRGAGKIDAIGLCLPGRRSPDASRVELAINLPCLEGEPVRSLLPRGVHAQRVAILPDAQAGAIGLARAEGLSGRLLAISIGTGVGAAVLDDGAPCEPPAAQAGHFGHIDVPIGGEHRRLEEVVGLPALRARFGAELEREGMIESLTAHDPIVVALASALRTAHALYRPDHVRLLGGVGMRLAPLLPAVRARVENALTPLARPGRTLACADSVFHAATGAAIAAIDQGA